MLVVLAMAFYVPVTVLILVIGILRRISKKFQNIIIHQTEFRMHERTLRDIIHDTSKQGI